jgi:3-oxoadipate enol-lactonase
MRATINGWSIDYNTYGKTSGLPVVFIHGFPFSQEMWRSQVAELSGDCRVITYDVRGHGKSEVGDGQYTIEFFVDDLIGLLDHLRIEKAMIVGLSMGGYIALRAIERNPERFRGLVLCDTRSEADTNEGKIKRATSIQSVKTDGVPARLPARSRSRFASAKAGRSAFRHAGVKKYTEGFVKAVFAPQTFERNAAAIKFIRNIIENTSPIAIAGTLLALASRTDTTESLSKINVPTLILVGEHDALTPVSAAKLMNEKIRQSELHVIPNAAHLSNLENPGEFNKHLSGFLRRIK